MREPSLNGASFPTAHCEVCGKDVLTYLGLDEAGGERRFCAHCDTPIGSGLRWVSADDLESESY